MPAPGGYSQLRPAAVVGRALSIVAMAWGLCACGTGLVSHQLTRQPPPAYRQAVELTQTPFNPQQKYHCGPAALATVLQQSGVTVSPRALAPQVFIPARKGALQPELAAAARRYGRIPYPLTVSRQQEPAMHQLLAEIKAGNPVLVLQNLGFGWFPVWHYAVVIGYDLAGNRVILRSGTKKRHLNSFKQFERTWRRAGYWGLVVTTADTVPATAKPLSYLKAVHALELSGQRQSARRAYLSALNRWPGEKLFLMALGNLAYAEKDLKTAEARFRRIIERHGHYAPALNNLAQVLMETGKAHRALKWARLAVLHGGREQAIYRKTLEQIQGMVKSGMR